MSSPYQADYYRNNYGRASYDKFYQRDDEVSKWE